MEDIHWARYEEVSGDSVPSRHHFPQISMCSPTQKLSESHHFGAFVDTSLSIPGGSVVKNLPANARDIGSILVREDPTCHGATKPVCHNY